MSDERLTGRKFTHRSTSVPMMLVDEDSRVEELQGWLVYMHPDGEWRGLRPATAEDRELVERATNGEWYGSCPDCKAAHTEPRYLGRCSACREFHEESRHMNRDSQPWSGSEPVTGADGDGWWWDAESLIDHCCDAGLTSFPRLLIAIPDKPDLRSLIEGWGENSPGEDDDGWTSRPKELDGIIAEAQAKIDAMPAWWYQPSNVRAEPTPELFAELAKEK